MPKPDALLDDALLQSRYAVGNVIGRGGFGVVYRARQRSTGQTVALKVLQPSTRSTRAWARFRREAQLCAALHHPHIVGLIDGDEANGAWLVFEWVPGRDLAAVLGEEGALEPTEAVRLMGQVLDALAATHSLGVVHRDIKPANIMVTNTGARRNAQVLDFGVSTLADGWDSADVDRVTQSGELVGTPAYAAPEQLKGEPPTGRTDLYAWALTFVECLTGRRVFSAQRLSHVLVQQLAPTPVELPPTLRDHRLEPVLTRALCKDPAERTVTAGSLLRVLDSLGPGEIGALAGPPRRGAGASRVDVAPTLIGPPSSAGDPGGPPPSTPSSTHPGLPVTSDGREFLSRVPLLRHLTPDELGRLTRAMYRRSLRAGERLAELGSPGTDAYIVREGSLLLELPLAGGATRMVARMGPGTVVGEVGLVEPSPRTLRIGADRGAEVYVIDGQRFGVLCDTDDPGAHKLLRAIALTLCDRLRQTTTRLQDELQSDDSGQREQVAVGLSDPIGVDRPWDRLKRLFGRSS